MSAKAASNRCCTLIRRTAFASLIAAGAASGWLLYLTFGIGCMAAGHDCAWFVPGRHLQ